MTDLINLSCLTEATEINGGVSGRGSDKSTTFTTKTSRPPKQTSPTHDTDNKHTLYQPFNRTEFNLFMRFCYRRVTQFHLMFNRNLTFTICPFTR